MEIKNGKEKSPKNMNVVNSLQISKPFHVSGHANIRLLGSTKPSFIVMVLISASTMYPRVMDGSELNHSCGELADMAGATVRSDACLEPTHCVDVAPRA